MKTSGDYISETTGRKSFRKGDYLWRQMHREVKRKVPRFHDYRLGVTFLRVLGVQSGLL